MCLNHRAIVWHGKKSLEDRKPIIWACLPRPRRETDAEGASPHPCGGFSVSSHVGLADSANSMERKSGFLSMKDWTKADYGRNAITGLLGGAIIGKSSFIIFATVGDLLFLLGALCGVVWIYKLFAERKDHD